MEEKKDLYNEQQRCNQTRACLIEWEANFRDLNPLSDHQISFIQGSHSLNVSLELFYKKMRDMLPQVRINRPCKKMIWEDIFLVN